MAKRKSKGEKLKRNHYLAPLGFRKQRSPKKEGLRGKLHIHLMHQTSSVIIHSFFLPYAFILFQISFISRLQRFWFHRLSSFTFFVFKIFTCYCIIILNAILYFKL